MSALAHAQLAQSVLDVSTRPGVTQRLLLLEPPAPKAAVLLFAGGDGGSSRPTARSMARREKALLSFKGGPCEAMAYHGFNGLAHEVVQQSVAWILAR